MTERPRATAARTTPYVNTIAVSDQPRYPGDLELEARIEAMIRWVAMAMVVRANREHPGLGGHISTYASCATLFEVAFLHFVRATDLAYLQGHASPGVYARAYLQGRLDADALRGFRRELSGGLPSYPHPRSMPRFWQFPTVSMGLGPLCAVYQARYLRYLAARDLAAWPTPAIAGCGASWATASATSPSPSPAEPGRARAARQPDLRGQLQPAAARRPGAG